jgi:hypothetical protein
MHSSNTCDMYEGFCIGCKSTAESFLFLFTFPLPPPQPALHAHHRLLSLSRFPHSFLQQATPPIQLRNVCQRQREQEPNEF